MSYTVQDLVEAALRKISALGSASSMSTAEKANMLEAMNLMLDGWWTDEFIGYALTEETHTLVASTASYTIGSGGNINSARPIEIRQAWIRDSNNNEFPLDVRMTEGEYNSYGDRATATGRPTRLFYDPQVTTGKIYLYPTPDSAETLYLRSWKEFTEFALITSTVTLPPGFKRAIIYNFAVEIAPEYNRSVSQEVVKVAREALDSLKRLYKKPKTLSVDAAIRNFRRADIMAGE